MITVFINLEGIIPLFGGTADTTEYATSYMSIILGGFIFQIASYILTSAVRTEGQPVLSIALTVFMLLKDHNKDVTSKQEPALAS